MVTVPRRSQGVTDSPRKSIASMVAKRGAVLNSGVARATPASWMLTVLKNRPRAKLNSPLSANHRKATTVSAGEGVPVEHQRQPHHQYDAGYQRNPCASGGSQVLKAESDQYGAEAPAGCRQYSEDNTKHKIAAP